MYVQIEKLKYFVAVVESGSINKTAEKLHISQQALSQMIHNIEKELNMQLLNRTNKGVFLTKDGERLYDSAEKILDIWDAFLFTDKNEDFEFLQQDITLRLSLPVGMEEKYIVSLVKNLSRKYPHIHLDIINEGCQTGIQELKKGNRQIVLGSILKKDSEPEPEVPFNVISYELNRENLYLMVSKNSKLALNENISWSDLHDQKIALNDMGNIDDYELYHFLQKENCLNLVAVHSFETLRQMVKSNLAISVCDVYQKKSRNFCVIPFPDPIVAVSKLWIKEEDSENPLIKVVIEQIKMLS